MLLVNMWLTGYSIHAWGSEIAADPPTVTFDSVIEGEDAERGVLNWLDKVVSSPNLGAAFLGSCSLSNSTSTAFAL